MQERFEVEVTVTDNSGLSAVQTLLVNVQNVNESPMAQSDILVASENQRLFIDSVSSLLSNDADLEQNALRLVDFTQPQNGKLTLNAQGFLVYEPNADFVGRDGFDYVVEDAVGLRVSARVWLDVIALSYPIAAAAQPTDYGVGEFDKSIAEQTVNTLPGVSTDIYSTIEHASSVDVAVGPDRLVESSADTTITTLATQDPFIVAASA